MASLGEGMGGLKDLAKLQCADDPEETTVDDKEEIDKDPIHDLLNKHEDIPPVSPRAVQTRIHLIETARWAFAMNDVYDMDTRRRAAQKKVAEHLEPTNPGKADRDEEDTKMTVQAVQKKVRRVFDGRYGRKDAQEHFDEVLEDGGSLRMSTDDSIGGDSSRGQNGAGAKRLAHEQAQETDLREHFSRGEQIEVFVETPPGQNGGEEAVATVNRAPVYDARVFIEPGRCTLHRATRVRCRIVYVDENFLKALALCRLD